MTGGPKYERLADDLRERITSGAIKPGGRMPSRNELMAKGYGERTVHEAVRRLAGEGWIVSVPGTGTFAADPLPAAVPTVEERLAAVEENQRVLAEVQRTQAEEIADLKRRLSDRE